MKSRTSILGALTLRQHFNRFAIATILAGGVLLPVAWPAEAQIVYTPTNITIGPGGTYNLDLNNDGVTDFTIAQKESVSKCPPSPPTGVPAVEATHPDGKGGYSLHTATIETPASGNGAEGKGNRPARPQSGEQIGPSERFSQDPKGFMAYRAVSCGGGASSGGNWFNAAGYLGLSFQVDGQTYYGWAYLTVDENFPLDNTTTLTGYAYESTPGMPINAGQTQ
jgi:hypothetical protein